MSVWRWRLPRTRRTEPSPYPGNSAQAESKAAALMAGFSRETTSLYDSLIGTLLGAFHQKSKIVLCVSWSGMISIAGGCVKRLLPRFRT